MNLPNFSIILPTYNRGFCITNAIDSLIKQDYKNWGLIIVDDGSTDNTEQLIHEKYEEYLETKQIQYVKSKHMGVSKARNIGLKKADYTWIGYLDSDNTLTDDYFKAFVEAIQQNKDIKIFYAQARIENRIVGQPFDRELLEKSNFIDLGTLIHRKELFMELGGFNEKLKRLVDWDLILKYTRNSTPMFIKRIVLNYNDSDEINRITNTENLEKNKKMVQKVYRIKSNVKNRLFLLKLKKRLLLINSASYKEKRATILFEQSKLFDREWYLKQYPMVKASKMTAERHYYRTGWKLGFNPSPLFDGNAYLKEHSDVKSARRNPLEHYLLSGQYEGRYYVSVDGKSFSHITENILEPSKQKISLMDKIKYALEYPIRVQEEYERLKAEIQELEKMNK